MAERNKKGQFIANNEEKTIEQMLKSFSLNGRDNADIFSLSGKNFKKYLSIDKLISEGKAINKHLEIMLNFKVYIYNLEKNNIKIAPLNYTIGCVVGNTSVSINVLNLEFYGKKNLDTLGIETNWESLNFSEKLTLIIEKLMERKTQINGRIAYLQSTAKQ